VFDWFWDRVTKRLLDSAVYQLSDAALWKDTLNPLIDSVIDRQIQRLQGKAGGLAKAAMPKFDVSSILGMVAQRFLMGNQPAQPINSTLPNVLSETTNYG
jgi:hypothetical protein